MLKFWKSEEPLGIPLYIWEVMTLKKDQENNIQAENFCLDHFSKSDQMTKHQNFPFFFFLPFLVRLKSYQHLVYLNTVL